MTPRRLRGLEEVAPVGGVRVFVARSARARLLGLALLDELPGGFALLLPRCSSVHTFGMRFALDIAFLDEKGRTLKTCAGVPPRRFVSCRGTAAVLEQRAAERPRGSLS